MKVFITGGTGFIGSQIIEYFLNIKKAEIHALVRDLNNPKWIKGLNIQYHEGDLFSIPSLPSDLEYVFHIAGSTKSTKSAVYYTVNQLGTASLFQTLLNQRLSPKKVVYLSSLAATGPSRDGNPVREQGESSPVTPYGWSKLQGEGEALKFKDKFPLVILRAGAVYGPRDRDFLSFFKLAKKGILPLLGKGKKMVSLCYVKDLARAFDLAVQKELPSGETFHIADPRPYTWEEIGEAAASVLGKKLRQVKIPLALAYPAALVSGWMGKIRNRPHIINRLKFNEMKQKAWVADVSLAQERLNFFPQYSLEEGIQETLDWYLQNGWL